jgi:hypothetical protein
MIPQKNVGETVREGDKVTLLIPKFSNPWMMKWLIPSRRSPHFRIHLDATGSRVWDLITGERPVHEICRLLKGNLHEEGTVDEADLRVTKFLNQLYRNRFIVFKPQTNDNRHKG